MKFAAIVLAALFAVAFARPQSPESTAQVVSQQSDIAPDLSQYSNGVETSNGIKAQEQGQLQQPRSAEEGPSYVVQGSYSYPAPDGTIITVTYTADANGFHPEVSFN